MISRLALASGLDRVEQAAARIRCDHDAACASYPNLHALVRAGSFVLDLRFDATLSTSAAFGTLGIGVNVT